MLIALAAPRAPAEAPATAPATAGVPATAGSYRFGARMEDGTQVELTLTQTGPESATIRETRWKRGEDPARDKPIYDDSSDLYAIHTARDGAKVICKSQEPIRDPTVTFTIGPPGAPKPLVTVAIEGTMFGVADRTTPYQTSERERGELLDFLRRAHFPALPI